MATLYDLDRDEFAALLAGEPSYRLDQLWQGLYGRSSTVAELTTLPRQLRAHLAAALPRALTLVAESQSRDGRTVKWLWELPDGVTIETVLMHYDERSTVCVSTQAGCAMACAFCATSQAGFDRQLSIGEVVEQVIEAQRRAMPRRVSNVVFMGMGEPLANFDSVWSAIERLHEDVGISARHLTVSTVGIVPGILRLAELTLPVSLAVSLHAANDELRDELVPINRRYPLGELADACQQYLAARGRRISLEWALIDGVNDRIADAVELASYARPLRAHVNLIPLNATAGYPARGTPRERVDAFRDRLQDLGANVTVRHNRGSDIHAACGQLRSASMQPASASHRGLRGEQESGSHT